MRLRRAVVGLAVVVTTLGLWAFWIEPARLRNENYRLAIPQWPAECSGLRVALLSDFHVGSPFNSLDKLDRIVAVIQAAKPDLVLLAGDFVIHRVVGGRFVAPEETAERLRKLSPPLGSSRRRGGPSV